MSKPDPLQEAVAEHNVTLTKSADARLANAAPWRPNLLYKNPGYSATRWAYACMRINRICEGATPARTYAQATKTATCPGLAHKYLETYFYLMSRNRPPPTKGADHNPFRRLSDKDALLKFVRIVEDICDQSTGKLGGWYTGISEVGAAMNKAR